MTIGASQRPPDSVPPAEVERPPAARTFDRHFYLALLVALCVVMPRTLHVSRAHSEYWDDQGHLALGISLLMRTQAVGYRLDPPLGQVVMSLPMAAMGCLPQRPEVYQPPAGEAPGVAPLYLAPLYGQKIGPNALRTILVAWKVVLFLPLAGLAFYWCRSLYGLGGGWLGLALLLIEPTVAAHVAPIALDLIGAETILFALFFAWRFFESPTRGRLIAAGIAAAAALLTKNTAAILPGVVALFALAHWLRDRRADLSSASVRKRLNQLLAGGAVATLALWPLCTFDVSRPSDHGPVLSTAYTEEFSFKADVINGALMRPWPAGVYVASLAGAYDTAAGGGNPGYLRGEARRGGWWYYYPLVAAHKVPVGVALVLLTALASLAWRRPTWGEIPLLIAAICWGLFVGLSGVAIGFRHILPGYVPMLMLAARCAAPTESTRQRRWPMIFAWFGVVVAAIDVARWHPDYLSYLNWPRDKAYLAVSDSNIDWGQSLKQVRRWIDDHPGAVAGRTVWLGYFGNPDGRNVPYHLGDRVRQLGESDPVPRDGLLIVSPVWITGQYGHEQYAFLRQRDPDATIGHSMLVYDLNRLAE